MVTTAALEAMLSQWRPGRPLPPTFYTSSVVFEAERERLFEASWFVVGHASRLAPGDVVVDEIAGAPILVVRDGDGKVRAFHNTCRHRGARVCERDGRRETLVCPYHQWTYALDGSLLRARCMPELPRAEHGLSALAVAEIAGLLFVRLDGRDGLLPPAEVEALLVWHGLRAARTAHVERWTVRANWKLLVENFDECYHCWPGHPEYCGVMAHARAEATGEAQAALAFEARRAAFEQDPARPKGTWPPSVDASFWCVQLPMHDGVRTQSRSGALIAPPMQAAAAGGVTSVRVDLFSHLVVNPDYALVVRFAPISATETELTMSWLVDGDAGSVDLDALTWLWRVTTEQDNAMVENQHAGLRSPAARLGPYADAEEFAGIFVSRYLARMALLR